MFTRFASMVVLLGVLLAPLTARADDSRRRLAYTEPEPSSFFQNALALGLTTAASIGLLVAGGLVLRDVDLSMDAVDRGRAGHMTQEEAFGIETRANFQAAGGWVLIGLGTGMAVGALSILLNDIVLNAQADSRADVDNMAFGVAPTTDGAVLMFGGEF